MQCGEGSGEGSVTASSGDNRFLLWGRLHHSYLKFPCGTIWLNIDLVQVPRGIVCPGRSKKVPKPLDQRWKVHRWQWSVHNELHEGQQHAVLHSLSTMPRHSLWKGSPIKKFVNLQKCVSTHEPPMSYGCWMNFPHKEILEENFGLYHL